MTLPPVSLQTLQMQEQRLWLLARLQSGQDHAASQAFSDCIRAAGQAGALARWGALAQGLLGLPATDGEWPAGLQPLAALPPPARLALLLRVLGRLDESEAATAMGVSVERYRALLAEAAPRDASGEVDAVQWQTLARAIDACANALDVRQTMYIAALRDAALPSGAVPDWSERRRTPRARWHLPVALAIIAAALLLLAWALLPRWLRGDPWHPRVERQPLPAAAAPAARYGADSAVLTHPDFAMVAMPVDAGVVRDIAFDSWYAAQRDAAPAIIVPLPDVPESAAAPDDAATL